MRRWTALFSVAGALLGMAAERAAFGFEDPVHWIPDLAVGWTFIGLGLAAKVRWADNNTGVLMAATGYTWFLGNFANVDNDVVAYLAANAIFVHRGFLVHLVLAYPTGRLQGRLDLAGTVAAYAAALTTTVWRNDVATIAFAIVLLAIRAGSYRRAAGGARRAQLLSLRATAVLSTALSAAAVAGLVGGTVADAAALVTYQVTLVAIAAGLFIGLSSAAWASPDVTDLVVELREQHGGTLRGQLSKALADPTLEVGYWSADAGGFVTAEGRALSLPQVGEQRSVTLVRREGEPVAAIVHDPAVLDDPRLLAAVTSAAQLAASNARLQTELQRRVAELAASRRRIIEAGDEERRRLERRLSEGAERRLLCLADTLRENSEAEAGRTTSELIARARGQLYRTLGEMRRLARGLHPRLLSEHGLGAALDTLAGSFPLPVSIAVTGGRLPSRVEAAAYFLCSEALANVAKHSSASAVRISVSREEEVVTVTVEDDGVGGADPAAGSGLRGLADRVETLGGVLRVSSATG